jgi:hypothetical protein
MPTSLELKNYITFTRYLSRKGAEGKKRKDSTYGHTV